MRIFTFGRVIVGAIIAAVVGIFSFITPNFNTASVADITLIPNEGTYIRGETFSVTVQIESEVPVNVFSGELSFDPSVLAIKKIDYNTSIADLWAERPWYSNGDGTLNFIGGTTRSGGYIGTDQLLTIEFETVGTGASALNITEAHILLHDGFGSDATLREPIDALFTVRTEEEIAHETVMKKGQENKTTIAIIEERPSTDLNNDGKQSLADVSIFMLNITSDDPRFDFNLDGKVNTKDLSALLSSE